MSSIHSACSVECSLWSNGKKFLQKLSLSQSFFQYFSHYYNFKYTKNSFQKDTYVYLTVTELEKLPRNNVLHGLQELLGKFW